MGVPDGQGRALPLRGCVDLDCRRGDTCLAPTASGRAGKATLDYHGRERLDGLDVRGAMVYA